jgi:hypothetical protein
MEPAPPNDQPPAASKPVMDVVPPKPTETLKEPPKEAEESVELKTTKAPVAKPPKRQGSGVGMAIFATVVIVIVLAALMVYAYLRTNHISVF